MSALDEPTSRGSIDCEPPAPDDQLPRASASAVKFDGDKPALDLIDPLFLIEIGQVLTFGAKKYAPGNWKKGMHLGKCLAGVLRHTLSILLGEYADPQSGLPHAAHAACGLMFAAFYIRNKMLNIPDDRWPR